MIWLDKRNSELTYHMPYNPPIGDPAFMCFNLGIKATVVIFLKTQSKQLCMWIGTRCFRSAQSLVLHYCLAQLAYPIFHWVVYTMMYIWSTKKFEVLYFSCNFLSFYSFENISTMPSRWIFRLYGWKLLLRRWT